MISVTIYMSDLLEKGWFVMMQLPYTAFKGVPLRGASFALVICMAALSWSVSPAAAGTETGEWCLTCPDWNNYEAWSKWAESQSSTSSAPPAGSEKPTNNQTIEYYPKEADPGSDGRSEFLAPIESVTASDVILDISPEADEYIEGAINVDYEVFLEDDARSKPVSDVVEILGGAGISRDDSVVIYGECLPCGGGPVPATYTYWLLKYLGHERVRILDGNIDDWKAAGLPTSEAPAMRPATDYAPQANPDLLATYDYVKSGRAQIVDARVAEAADPASIPGSVNIPVETILEGEKIKGAEDLEAIFNDLRKDQPVVVYTNTGVNGAVVWFALEMTGYDAILYSWRDWLEKQPALEIDLLDAAADPNPAGFGESVRINASFKGPVAQPVEDGSGLFDAWLAGDGRPSSSTGSPRGSASLDAASRTVRISSSATKTSEAIPDELKCTAIITGRDGTEVGRASLLQTTEGDYAGVWVADVDPGAYSLSILASRSGSARYFERVLDLVVTDG
jgi:thiosulfate/3-mercaptopyruvate sulfurtransferase